MLRIVGILLVFLLLQFGSVPFITWCHGPHADTMVVIAESLVCSSLLTVLFMFLFGWVGTAYFRFPSKKGKAFVWALLLMFPMIYLINLMLEMLSLEDVFAEMFQQLVHMPLGIVSVVLIGPMVEELVFRKGVFGTLMERGASPWLSIFVSALLFGVIHGNPVQMGGAFLFGWILAWMYWKSGTVWLPYVAHVFNNLVGVLLIFAVDGDTTLMSLSGGGFSTLLCVAVALLWAYWAFRNLDQSLSSSVPDGASLKGEG